MPDYRQTILVSVGTSLLDPGKEIYYNYDQLQRQTSKFKEKVFGDGLDAADLDWKVWRSPYQPNDHLIQFYEKYCGLKVEDWIKKRKREDGYSWGPNERDKLSAEHASLYMFYNDFLKKENQSQQDKKDEIILLASDTGEGLYCACFLAEYLTEKFQFKDQIEHVSVVRIRGLEADDSASFKEEGLHNLVKQVTNVIEKRVEEGNWSVLMNVTGGYKGILPYLTLLGMAYEKIDLFYLFELSPALVWIPKLPVGFDLLRWRDYRGFLRAIPHIADIKEEYLEFAFSNTPLPSLFEKKKVKGKLLLNPLGDVFNKWYEKERGKTISEYGRGYQLSDQIKDENKRRALQECIDLWQYLWIGDRIPETVEHARGHAQRDLELAAQVIMPILKDESSFFGNKTQTDDSLLALIATVWLHDIGHSGDEFEWENEDEDGNKNGKKIPAIVRGFPSLVRDIHHFLTYHLIQRDKVKLFREKNAVFTDSMIDDIRLLCLYHRGEMPTECGQCYKHIGIEVHKPLNGLNKGDINLPLLGALFRVIDGSEVQMERTVSPEYEEMRNLQNDREIHALKREEEEKRLLLSNKLSQSNGQITLPLYLQRLLEVAKIYFKGEDLEVNQNDFCCLTRVNKSLSDEKKNKLQEKIQKLQQKKNLHSQGYQDEYLDLIVDFYTQEYIQEDATSYSGLQEEIGVVVRDWLSALNQFIFKKRQPDHFTKHKGVSAVLYLPNVKNDTASGKFRFHYDVLAIYRKGSNDKESAKLKENAKKVLKDIFDEYDKVKHILNENRIFFGPYYRMEETEEMKLVFNESGEEAQSPELV